MLSVQEFHQKYELSDSTIHVAINQGKLDKSIINLDSKRRAYIDETYFTSRKQLQRSTWMQNHRNYNFLSRTINDMTLSEMMSDIYGSTKDSWYCFFYRDLFSEIPHSIMVYEVSNRHKQWNEASTAIIQRLFRCSKHYFHPKEVKRIISSRELSERIWK